MKNTRLLALAAALSTTLVHAQKPADTLPAGGGLQLQIDPKSTPTPAFKGPPVSASAIADSRPGDEAPAVKKAKGPTQIDSLEVTFDQKKNEAIFIGEVVVRDPEFNVTCDKLTAILRSAEKPKPAAEGPGQKPATPGPRATPATPAAAAAGTPAPAAKKPGGSGLQKAIAEAKPGKRVHIVQDKVQPDGTTQRSTGIADKAVYDAVTGDITLTGMPQVQQGANLIEASDPSTVIILNRAGRMRADGPTRMTIIDKGDSGL